MKDMNDRVRYYFNLGAITFVVGYLLALANAAELALPLSFLFNFLIWRRVRGSLRSPYKGLLAISVTTIVAGICLIQCLYRLTFDFGCLGVISDTTAGVSYLSTMLLFSTVLWELGIGFLRKVRPSLA